MKSKPTYLQHVLVPEGGEMEQKREIEHVLDRVQCAMRERMKRSSMNGEV